MASGDHAVLRLAEGDASQGARHGDLAHLAVPGADQVHAEVGVADGPAANAHAVVAGFSRTRARSGPAADDARLAVVGGMAPACPVDDVAVQVERDAVRADHDPLPRTVD